MSAPDPLQVVIVAFAHEPMLTQCLERLGRDLPVTVVDNAGRPECRAVCERFGARYIDAGSNLGFAGGVNIGLEASATNGDVLLLNPDARIDAVGVQRLRAHLSAARDTVCCVAPAQIHPTTGASQRVLWPFPSPGRQWLIALGLGALVRRGDYVVGSVLLLNRNALAEVGPFDERYFLYAEETDWQRRAVEAGWVAALVADVAAEHVGAATSTRPEVRDAYFHAAHEIYLRKWFGAGGWAVYRSACLMGDAMRWATGGRRRALAGQRIRIYARGPVRHRAAVLAAVDNASAEGA